MGINSDKAQWVDQEERNIAVRLFRLRKQRGIDRETLAKKTGLSESDVTSYELANVPVPASALVWFAKALEVNIDYFYSDETIASTMHSAPSKKQEIRVWN